MDAFSRHIRGRRGARHPRPRCVESPYKRQRSRMARARRKADDRRAVADNCLDPHCCRCGDGAGYNGWGLCGECQSHAYLRARAPSQQAPAVLARAEETPDNSWAEREHDVALRMPRGPVTRRKGKISREEAGNE